MKKLAYFKITEDMTPRDASETLAMAKKAGFDNVLVYHHEKADITNAKYKEKLLSVFRAAYRHKVGVYIADDRYPFSGTGFGQLSSVRDLWQKVMVIKKKDAVAEGEKILCERDGECVVVTCPEKIDKFPCGHMPDLTNSECANLIVESVYKPLVNEYKKFVGYEFKGFLCNCPICDCVEYEGAPYCKDAVEKYMEHSNGKGDLFKVASREREDDYLDFLSIDESFVMPLKNFCDENGLEFALSTGESSVSESFGRENSSIFLDPMGTKCYIPEVCDSYGALWAYEHKCEPVIKVGYGMEKFQNIGRIFKEYPDCECVGVADLKNADKDCYVFKNDSAQESVSLGFLLDGDWCVYDWEKDELYDWDKKGTYTFYPESILCIVRKIPTMYTDKMPVKVGRVVTWDFEEKAQIEAEKRDNKYAFYLPDEQLSDKAVMIYGKAESVKAKLGAMEYDLIKEPYIIPLFDFQRDAGCLVEAIGGDIDKIAIIAKKQMD